MRSILTTDCHFFVYTFCKINPFKKPSDVTDAKIEDDTEDLRYFENPGMYRTRYGSAGCGVFNGGIKN